MNNYNDLLIYYEENKHKPVKDWLIFDSMLIKPSKQGILGLFKKKAKFEIGTDVYYLKKNTTVRILDIDHQDDSYHIQLPGDDRIICTVIENLRSLNQKNENNDPKYVFKISR